jgi:hypothetical protein
MSTKPATVSSDMVDGAVPAGYPVMFSMSSFKLVVHLLATWDAPGSRRHEDGWP